jgi:sugar phosphate isomerase/epimerase
VRERCLLIVHPQRTGIPENLIMEKHWDAYCGLSLVHFLAFPDCQGGDGPILESITQIAQDDFFSAIEITRINDSGVRHQVARLIEQTHLGVDFGVHPMILGGKLNLNSLDSAERTKAKEALKPYVDQAAEIGARRFALLSGPDPGEATRAEATRHLIESLQELCAYARERRLPVVLETFDRKVDKRALIGPADEAVAVAATLRKDFPDFALLYDQAHMILLDETPLQGLGKLKEYLAHVHVGNCVTVPGRPSYGDFHPRFGFPGSVNDVAELAGFVDALFQVGYLSENPPIGSRPGVGFEVRPQAGETSAAILANIKRAWRQAWPAVQGAKAVRNVTPPV